MIEEAWPSSINGFSPGPTDMQKKVLRSKAKLLWLKKAARSGKTVVAVAKILEKALTNPGMSLAIASNNFAFMHRSVIFYLQRLEGLEKHISRGYTRNRPSIVFKNGSAIYFLTGRGKLLGLNLDMAYITAESCSEELLSEILSRTRPKGQVLIEAERVPVVKGFRRTSIEFNKDANPHMPSDYR